MQKEWVITTTADRPDLVPAVARWLWHEVRRHDSYTLEQTRAVIAVSLARSGPPQTFVLLVDGKPIGTATLAAEDLDERPDLTPWLAGVFVVPEARGQGYVAHLIAAVEAACRAASMTTVWLYTNRGSGSSGPESSFERDASAQQTETKKLLQKTYL